MSTLITEKRETYRVVVTRRNVSEILTVANKSEFELPTVRVLPNRRLAEQLTAEILHQWHLRTYCLFISDGNGETPNHPSHAVVECTGQEATPPAETTWTALSEFPRHFGVDVEDHAIVRKTVEELKSASHNTRLGPFTRPGWLSDLLRWVREQLDMLGLRPTREFTQLNASPTFSLIRFETTGPAVWFKATGEPNQRELPISVAIARLLPTYVPLILGIHPEWNGWLTGELPGTSLDEISDPIEWDRAADTLARMQIESVGATEALVEAGCKDLRTAKLLTQVNPFLTRMAILMERQEKKSPAPLNMQQIELIGVQLREAISSLSLGRLPDALTHIDFNPGNILLSPERCSFLDWAEGSTANPLITFEFLREHFTRRKIGGVQRIREAYVRPWLRLFSQEQIVSAMKYSPLVAVFAYAVRDVNWLTDEAHQSAHQASYFRALTRRMYLEAVRLTETGAACLD